MFCVFLVNMNNQLTFTSEARDTVNAHITLVSCWCENNLVHILFAKRLTESNYFLTPYNGLGVTTKALRKPCT